MLMSFTTLWLDVRFLIQSILSLIKSIIVNSYTPVWDSMIFINWLQDSLGSVFLTCLSQLSTQSTEQNPLFSKHLIPYTDRALYMVLLLHKLPFFNFTSHQVFIHFQGLASSHLITHSLLFCPHFICTRILSEHVSIILLYCSFIFLQNPLGLCLSLL